MLKFRKCCIKKHTIFNVLTTFDDGEYIDRQIYRLQMTNINQYNKDVKF